MFRSIRWRIAVPYLVLILAAMAVLSFYLLDLARAAYLEHLEAQLAAEGRLIADVLAPSFSQQQADLDAAARRYADLLGVRVTLIGSDGVVLGESHEDRAQMDNHLYRPEVQQALRTGQGSAIRRSDTMGYDMMYTAVLVMEEGTPLGYVRLALPLGQIESSLAHLRWTLASAALLTALGATLLALLIAARTTQPVRSLTEVVHRMAEGDLDARLLPVTRDEVGALTHAFNHMADRLRNTITSLNAEQARLAAVLDTMADGALITGNDERVHLINPAAARLLDVAQKEALGRSFAAVARDHQIIALWRQCRESRQEQFGAVEINRKGPFLQVVVTPLGDGEDCLVILQDLTRVRKLETVRRDFISNISHELRTPLASLKSLVETLRDSALDDRPAAIRFLDRMETEVDALTQMVQELLELARIESGKSSLRLAPTDVADIILPPVERLRSQAERAGLQLVVELPPETPRVLADAERMQQVIMNLVHNAIKFTPAGGRILVCAATVLRSDDPALTRQGAEALAGLVPCVLISVADTGVGIAADDLPRIFERFYKADRARSGGGTGLGLSIAKHIVQAHGGCIWAESMEGMGATFYVALPVVP